MRFFKSVNMKHTKNRTNVPSTVFSKLVISNTTQEVIQNILSSKYATRLLQENFMTKADIESMPLGALTWLVTEGVYNAIKENKITLQAIKTLPANDCLEMLKKYAEADKMYEQITSLHRESLTFA